MGGIRIIREEGGQGIYEGRSDKKKCKTESLSYQELKYIKTCESLGVGGRNSKILKSTQKKTIHPHFHLAHLLPVLFFN